MTFWVALASALTLTGVLVPVLRRAGLYDIPNDRSSHFTPTPRGGGLAVLAAFVASVAVVGDRDGVIGTGVVVASALTLGAVGLIDDVRSLPSVARLLAQGIVALIACLLLVVGTDSEKVVIPVFIAGGSIGFVAYVNAFNFMDGVNGISALSAGVAGGWFAWLGNLRDLPALVVLGAALAGAAIGFLPWNAASRIFLGDVGSYGMGAVIASIVLVGWDAGVPGALMLAPVLVYLADTGWVIVKRARAAQPLLEAHRDHVYQRLVQAGWPHVASAAWASGLSAGVCVTMATLHEEAPALAALVVACILVGYLATPRLASRVDAAVPSVSEHGRS